MILVTGGCGYIGSHTVLSLIEAGEEVAVLDNLVNGNKEALARIESLTGTKVPFYEVDILDHYELKRLFDTHHFSAVVHFAALKAVGESAQIPLSYYQSNVTGTLNVLDCMQQAGVKRFVYSSSATVYGEKAPVPYVETMPLGQPSSPYGATKAMIERVLQDLAKSDSHWDIVSLRYFNPIGAHESGQIGEDPKGIPNNLLPFIAQVAVGRRDKLSIFGDDYPTADGTCERDYLHVMDLAEGHVAALKWMQQSELEGEVNVFNLGTGQGTSVQAMVDAFERVTDVKIATQIAPRREGDLPAFWADASKAQQHLGWSCKRDLDQMLIDTWLWQSNNPDGY